MLVMWWDELKHQVFLQIIPITNINDLHDYTLLSGLPHKGMYWVIRNYLPSPEVFSGQDGCVFDIPHV